MAHPRHEEVRRRYNYRCGYCGVTETDAGGHLTVDHFHPVMAGGDDSEDNLVYACARCNLYKGATVLDVSDPTAPNRLLHPGRDNVSEHIRDDELTGLVEGLTPQGQFQIAALRLNRPELIENRLRRQLIAAMEARLEQQELDIAVLRERLDRRELYVRNLERQVRDE